MTFVADLFDMLLPMLGIYQEYVRNHHYSLQVLAEYKQKPDFNQLLRRYEEKSVCEGRSLATFLTYPMHQVLYIAVCCLIGRRLLIEPRWQCDDKCNDKRQLNVPDVRNQIITT
jgi:RhoGEF domain